MTSAPSQKLAIRPGKTTPPLGTLWLGTRIPMMEMMCLLSMVKAGWDITVFGYQRFENLPEEIEFRDAREVFSENLSDTKKRGILALPGDMFADIFRLFLNKYHSKIWVDSDFFATGRNFPGIGNSFFSVNDGLPNNATMHFASDDALLDEYLELTSPEFPEEKPYYRHRANLHIRSRRDGKDQFRRNEMHGRHFSGPFLLRYLLNKYGRMGEALPADVLYPVPYTQKRLFWSRKEDVIDLCSDQTWAIHLWGSAVRKRLEAEQPERGSFFDGCLAEFGLKNKIYVGARA